MNYEDKKIVGIIATNVEIQRDYIKRKYLQEQCLKNKESVK